MEPQIAGWNIVLVGAWNPAIFTPQWIAQNLFQIGDGREIPVQINFALNVDERVLKFDDQQLTIRITPGRLTLQPTQLENDSLGRVNLYATRILESLRHTPIIAAGFNFQYKSDDPSSLLMETMRGSDLSNLTDLGYEIRETQLAISMEGLTTCGNPRTKLMIKKSLTDGAYTLDFNFHYGESSADELVRRISNGFTELRLRVTQLLNSYGETESASGGDPT